MSNKETGNFWLSTPEPTPMDHIYYWTCVMVLAVIAVAVIFGIAVYFYASFGDVFWAWASLNF